jgi:hypothetical protein
MARTQRKSSDRPPAALQATLAKSLAPEDIRAGDHVAVLQEIYEYPSWYWCDDAVLGDREEVVRIRYTPRDEALPLAVESVCLPFVLVRRPCGGHATLDVRRVRLARLDATYAKAALKAYRKTFRKRRRPPGCDPTSNL